MELVGRLGRFVLYLTAILLLTVPCRLGAQTVPAGTVIQIRLRQTVSSFGSRARTPVSAVVIAPVEVNGAIVIPLGAQLDGSVYDVRRVGLGFARESAWVQLSFDKLRLPGGAQVPFAGKVADVDNARETVDDMGRIRGIRATASFSSVISGFAFSVAALDPMLLAFGLSSSLSVFRIPESEVVLPVGTEMRFTTSEAIAFTTQFPPAAPGMINSTSDLDKLTAVIRDLPFRTATQNTNLPSDLTNLAFLGTEQALRAAFSAAGWVETDSRDARSTYGTMRSIVENQGYREAPMSTLLLNGQQPRITYAKTLNTFFERHHLRVFAQDGTFNNQPLWTSSSTHDSGIGFATAAKTFIHVIDQNIDEERTKVVNDLILTGCVSGLELVDRPWVPLDASNATGDQLKTDGRIAVLKLNDCGNPNRADAPASGESDLSTRPSVVTRATRNTLLTLRNDLFRGNIVYQGYSGIKMAGGALKKHAPTGDQPRKVTYAGEQWQIVSGPRDLKRAAGVPKDPVPETPTFVPPGSEPKTYPTFLEFSVSGGYMRFGNEQFSTQPILFSIPFNGLVATTTINAVTSLRPGWNVAGTTTFNAHRHFSHELGFTLNTSTLRVDLVNPIVPTSRVEGDLQIRQFHYALLAHLRPNGARLRPYVAVGGGLQVIRLTESIAQGNTVLKLAFKEANILYSAFRFAGEPPLQGGGIFQPTLNYGAGIKYHVTRRFVVRADFRETLSAQPDFWTKSYPSLVALELDNGGSIAPGVLQKNGLLRLQRLSLGVGITF